MNRINEITYTPLRQSILQLEMCCDELEEDHGEEVSQIRLIIERAVDDILDGGISDADERLALVKARLNAIVEQRKTDPGIEVIDAPPKSGRYPIT